MEVLKAFRFEAAHMLPDHKGLCSNLHGHSWKLGVAVSGSIDQKTGMVMDFAEIKEKVQPLIDQLDHSYLGCWVNKKVSIDPKSTKIPDFRPFPFDNPTSENIILAIGSQLIKVGLRFSRLILEETCTSTCYVEYEEVSEWRMKQ